MVKRWLTHGAFGEVLNESQLSDVTVYEFNLDNELTRIIHGRSAQLKGADWTLLNGDVIQLGAEQGLSSALKGLDASNVVSKEPFESQPWKTTISLDNLSALRVEPENMNIVNLYQYRQYLEGNGLETKNYDLAFWQKVFQPVSTAVMIILAASFIFGPMRSVSMGARVLVGVLTGMVYFFAVRSFGPVSLVAGLPAFFGALMPPLIFAVAAWYLLKRAG